jgi:hypothetical protein
MGVGGTRVGLGVGFGEGEGVRVGVKEGEGVTTRFSIGQVLRKAVEAATVRTTKRLKMFIV